MTFKFEPAEKHGENRDGYPHKAQNIRIMAFFGEEMGQITSSPKTYKELYAFLESLREKVPEEYKDSCKINIDSSDGCLTAEVFYFRIETLDEYLRRVQEVAVLKEKKEQGQKQRDMAELERIRKKYGL